jgi:GT2 family glycosyltransferase
VVVVVVNEYENQSVKDYLKLGNSIFIHIQDLYNNQIDYCKFDNFIILSDNNLGFSKANNLAVKFISSFFMLEELLFVNNDILIPNCDVYQKLSDKLNNNINIGIIGPKILGLDNNCQSPERYYSLYEKYLFLPYSTLFLSKQRKNKLFNLNYSNTATEGFHYKLMGCFMLMKYSTFKECGMMDENTFLYSEEIILSERLAKISKFNYYLPDVSVIHIHEYSTSKKFKTFEKNKLIFKSEIYFYKEYKNCSSFEIFFVKLFYYIFLFFKDFKITISR